MTIGIYVLIFPGTHKVYIGQSVDIENRITQHLYKLKYNKASPRLQEAYNMYGKPSFKILEECTSEDLDKNEREAISIYNSFTDGFNTTEGGSTGRALSGTDNANAKYTEEDIVCVFNLLIEGDYTHKRISEITGVGIGAISPISSGKSHKWLKDKYPDKYEQLLALKGNRHSKKEIVLRNTTTGIIHKIRNVTKFARDNKLSVKEANILIKNLFSLNPRKLSWELIG